MFEVWRVIRYCCATVFDVRELIERFDRMGLTAEGKQELKRIQQMAVQQLTMWLSQAKYLMYFRVLTMLFVEQNIH